MSVAAFKLLLQDEYGVVAPSRSPKPVPSAAAPASARAAAPASASAREEALPVLKHVLRCFVLEHSCKCGAAFDVKKQRHANVFFLMCHEARGNSKDGKCLFQAPNKTFILR